MAKSGAAEHDQIEGQVLEKKVCFNDWMGESSDESEGEMRKPRKK